jgi:hypothetical protein
VARWSSDTDLHLLMGTGATKVSKVRPEFPQTVIHNIGFTNWILTQDHDFRIASLCHSVHFHMQESATTVLGISADDYLECSASLQFKSMSSQLWSLFMSS